MPRSANGCAFQRKDAGAAALPFDSTRTHLLTDTRTASFTTRTACSGRTAVPSQFIQGVPNAVQGVPAYQDGVSCADNSENRERDAVINSVLHENTFPKQPTGQVKTRNADEKSSAEDLLRSAGEKLLCDDD